MAKAEIAKSMFFFLSKRLMERKFNLHKIYILRLNSEVLREGWGGGRMQMKKICTRHSRIMPRTRRYEEIYKHVRYLKAWGLSN